MNSQDKYLTLLESRTNDGSYRSLVDYSGRIDFWSNDYLGASHNPISVTGSSGSTGSRLISGNSVSHEACEERFASYFNQPAALLYNSGYDANLGLFSCLPQREDTILYDEFCHASIRDGIRLSNARSFSFKHNDLEALEEKLKRATGEIFIAVESIYSMDGDVAPLEAITALGNIYNAKVIVDEAHSAGIVGTYGEGKVSELGLDQLIFAKIITLGKAFGLHGAFVLGNKELRSFLINYSRSFIYTTAPSEYHVAAIMKRLDWIKLATDERTMLFDNIATFSKISGLDSSTPIFNFETGSTEKAKEIAEKLLENGIACKAILSPTVPKGQERLRICLHSFNTEKELVLLSKLLK